MEVEELGEDVLNELRNTLDELLGKHSSDRSEPAHHVLLEVTGQVYGIQRDIAGFISTTRSIAATNARIWPHTQVRLQQADGPEQTFVALVNAAYVFAKVCKGPFEEAMQFFARSIETIVEAWPNANVAAMACLDGIVQQLDVPTATKAIWPVLMTLRSRP